jgi:amino acid transporter/nucleotide-binding universal stress UspA family protein
MEKDGLSLKFRRDLRFRDLVSIGVGAMTGATIYVMAGQATALAGTGVLLALVFNYIVTMLTGMSYAELSSVYPEAGGGYLFVEETLPKPFGFMGGWISWFSHSIADAFYTVVFATGLLWLFQAYGLALPFNYIVFEKLLILAILIVIIFINYWGTATTGKSQTIITNLQLILLGVFIVAGTVAIIRHPQIPSNFLPFSTTPIGILLAMGLLFVAFEGYEIIAQGAEETNNPEKNIPRAIFISIGIITILYFIIFFLMLGGAGTSWVASHGESTMVDYGKIILGSYGPALVILAMLVGSGATLNATVFSAIRVSFAMGRNGSLPKTLAKIHKVHRTPHIATIVTGVIIGGMALFLPMDTIVAAASIMFLLLFTLVNIALIVNRYENPNLKRAYSVPLFPLIPILAIITKLMIAFALWIFSPESWYIAILWIEAGLIIYYFWAGKREIEKEVLPSKPPKAEKPVTKNNILLPLADEFPNSVKLGSVIANNMNSNLYLFSALEVPMTISPQSITYADTSERIKMMERMQKISKKYDKNAEIIISVSHNRVSAIIDEVKEKDISLIFFTWRQKKGRRLIFGSTLEKIYREAPCDLVVFKNGLPEKINEVSLVISKRKSSDFSFNISMALAKVFQSKLKIYEFTYNGNVSVSGDKYYKIAKESGLDVSIVAHISDGILGKIISISKSSELLIIAPPSEYLDGRIPLTADPKIVGKMDGPILLVRKVKENEDMSELAMLFHG